MIQDIDEINVNLGNDNSIDISIDNDNSISVTEGTPTDISEIMHNEEIRQENEAQRIANEEDREDYIDDLKQRVLDGEFNGEDGYSPTANVSKSGTTSTITITDKNGTTTADVLDGTNGIDGRDGTDGQDGYSPSASVSKSGSTATITITDKNGTTTASVSDGEDGQDGTDGEDGISPTVTMTKQGKVTTLTITDKDGEHTTEIKDGQDGSGTGDMLKATYDTNDNGIVDNAEKVNNHTVQSDVPANAVFTDTTYTAGTGIDITNNVISSTQSSAEWGNITGTLSDQTDLNSALGGKQDLIDSTHKLSSDLIDDTNHTNKFLTTGNQTIAGVKTFTSLPKYNNSSYPSENNELVTKLYVDENFSNKTAIMPTASANYYGDIFQYIGQTTANYTNGYFYKCVRTGTMPNYTYSWQKIDVQDLSGKQDLIDSSHKLNADLVDDSTSTNKFVTSTDITNWNNKSDFSGSYNDLTNKPTIPDELADLSDDSTHRLVNDTEKITWNSKQAALVSGTNIKTINNTSILGSGNLDVGADIPQQDTAPSNPSTNDLWIDTDESGLTIIDSTISTTSTNPIENQAITNYVDSEIQDTKDYVDTKTNADSWQVINNWLAYKKCGNIVTIRGYSRNAKTLSANSYTNLGNLPASVRPAYELLSNWAIIGEAKLGLLVIGTNGDVQAFTESGTSYWGFTITYVI